MNKLKRIILKLSGESLSGENDGGICRDTVINICSALKDVLDLGTQVGIVVGGGNFWRGRDFSGMDKTRADHIGMLATVMNALAIADALEMLGCEARVQTSVPIIQFAEPYIRQKAIRHLIKKRVVIFGCGTGNPFFTTDSAAALRAAEIGADALLKATMVDGIYNKDPNKYKDAIKYDKLSHNEVLQSDLKVMDATAAALCRENNMPIIVFDIANPQNIVKAVKGEKIGTVVS